MASKFYSTRQGKPANRLVYEVVRPQRARLSRYKIKKQASIIESILADPLIMTDQSRLI